MLADYRSSFEKHIRSLSAFGHRGSATKNEHRAAGYLCQQLQQLGLEPQRQPFAGGRSLGVRIWVHLALATFGAACIMVLPIASIAFTAVALVSLWIEHTKCVAWLSKPLVRHPSANIVTTLPAQALRKRVVLFAHYDTQRSGFIWFIFAYLGPLFWWVPAFFKPPLMSIVFLMLGQIALATWEVAWGLGPWLSLAYWLTLGIYAFVLFMIGQWAIGRYVQGAGDNATGVAGVLTICQQWQQSPVDHVELVVVFTGCEESGLLGAAAWADQNQELLKTHPTVFLNLDNLGFGPPRFFASEVPLCGWPVAYSPEMIAAATAAAKDIGLEDAGPHSLPGPTDALALLTRGMQGMSIVSFRKWGFMPTYHRLLDTTENLDFDAAWMAILFGEALLQRIAHLDELPLANPQ
jgi:hypothetical protein